MATTIPLALHSRLRFGNLLTIQGVVQWDTLYLPTFAPRSDDISYQVQYTDRIDNLANRFYGDPVLWWVIAVANNMEILPIDLNPASTLRIPSKDYVLRQLFLTAVTS
jgi:hypothetical protein